MEHVVPAKAGDLSESSHEHSGLSVLRCQPPLA